jgi:hypothetical protein
MQPKRGIVKRKSPAAPRRMQGGGIVLTKSQQKSPDILNMLIEVGARQRAAAKANRKIR